MKTGLSVEKELEINCQSVIFKSLFFTLYSDFFCVVFQEPGYFTFCFVLYCLSFTQFLAPLVWSLVPSKIPR